ncbi:hypothetical protein pb186bvf_003527 [Paramecium bursaria]
MKSQRKNDSIARQPQQLQLQYLSQPKQIAVNFVVEEVSPTAEHLIQSYIEMINQETDIYYLYDSFNQILNSLRQAQDGMKQQKMTTQSRSNTLDWWKVTGSSQSWTGMRNIQSLQESHLKESKMSNQSRGDTIIDNLKRQIGEMTEEQKFKQNSRSIGGVPVQIFNENDLQIRPGKQLLTIYQIQNRFHKCHLGFAMIKKENNEVIIQKLYIAKWHRKNGNFFILIKEFVRFIILQGALKIKIKINSYQSGLIKNLQGMGFKLTAQCPLFGDLKVLSLILISKDFN